MSKGYSSDFKNSLQYVQNISNSNLNPYPIDQNKYVDNNLEETTDLDDICTSISQVPVNPLYREYFPSIGKITLPEANLVMDHRFWEGQVKEKEEEGNDQIFNELTMSSKSIDTFTPNKTSKDKKTEYITRWSVSVDSENFLIVGRDRNGMAIMKDYYRRISMYIFYDRHGTVCSLQGCSDPDPDLPFYIREKFKLGIPANWQKIVQAWRHYISLGSPSMHKWPDLSPLKKHSFQMDDPESTDFESANSSIAMLQLRKKIAKMKVRLRAMILRESMMSEANNLQESIMSRDNATIRNVEFGSTNRRKNLTNNFVDLNINRTNNSINSFITRNKVHNSSTVLDKFHKKPEIELSSDSEILENFVTSDESENLHLSLSDQLDSDEFCLSDKRDISKHNERQIAKNIGGSTSKKVVPQMPVNKKINNKHSYKLPVKGSKLHSLIDHLKNSQSISLNTNNKEISSQLESYNENDEDIFLKPTKIETSKIQSQKRNTHNSINSNSNTNNEVNTNIILVGNESNLPKNIELNETKSNDNIMKKLASSNKQFETSQSNTVNSETIRNKLKIDAKMSVSPPKDQSANSNQSDAKNMDMKQCFVRISNLEKWNVEKQFASTKKPMIPEKNKKSSENNKEEEIITPKRSRRLNKLSEFNTSLKNQIIKNANKSIPKVHLEKLIISPDCSQFPHLNKSKPKIGQFNSKREESFVIVPEKNVEPICFSSTLEQKKLNKLAQEISESDIEFKEKYEDEKIISEKKRSKHINKLDIHENKTKNSVTVLSKTNPDVELFIKSFMLEKLKGQKPNFNNLNTGNNMDISHQIALRTPQSSRKCGKPKLNKSGTSNTKETEKKSTATPQTLNKPNNNFKYDETIQNNSTSSFHTELSKTNLETNNNMEMLHKISINTSKSPKKRAKSKLNKSEASNLKKPEKILSTSRVSISSNTSVSTRGRKRVATLPFWEGARLKISKEKTIITKNLQNIDIDLYTSSTEKDSSNVSTLTYENVFNNLKKSKNSTKMQLMSTFRDSIKNSDSASKDIDNVNVKNVDNTQKINDSLKTINSPQMVNFKGSTHITMPRNKEKEKYKINKTAKDEHAELTREARGSNSNNNYNKKKLKPKQTAYFKVPKPIKIKKSLLPINQNELLVHSFIKNKHKQKENDTIAPVPKKSPVLRKRKMFKNDDWLQSEECFNLLAQTETSPKFSIKFNSASETEDEKFSEVSAFV